MLSRLDAGWMTIGWTSIAALCLTLSGIYLILGARLRSDRALAYLLFAVVAIGAGGMAVSEMLIGSSSSVEQYARGLRAIHIPYALLTLPLPWFVYILFGTGRRWLILLSNALYVAVLGLNFVSPHSRLFGEIVAVETHTLLGDTFTHALGTSHPGRWLGQVATVVLLVFIGDAAISLWRKGGRRRAAVIGGTALASAGFGVGHSALVSAGAIHSPYLVSVGFLFLLGGMAWELVDEALQAVVLGRRVQQQAAELDEKEARIRLATDSADIGLWSWSSDDSTFWLSPRSRGMLKLEAAEDVPWSTILDRVHPDDRARVLRLADRLRSERGEFEIELRLGPADAPPAWIVVKGRAEVESGHIVRVRGAVRNVTERRLTQAALARQRAEVAHLSRVTMLSEMSGSLAHELNQPLTAILSNAQAGLRFLRRGTPDLGEVDAALAAIVHEDRYARDVIDRLRSLLKKGEPTLEALDINGLIEDVVQLEDMVLASEGVRIETELAADLPAVQGDRVLLTQVVMNLVRNAADAMAGIEPDRRVVTIRTGSVDGTVRISVVDRGPGIPEGDLELVFEPFYSTRQGGSGLGLSVSRTIVRMHGGEIRAAPGEQAPGANVVVLLSVGSEVDHR